jgi:hypothetical protein
MAGRYVMITLALLPDEKSRVQQVATAKGISVSLYMRQCIEQDWKLHPPVFSPLVPQQATPEQGQPQPMPQPSELSS